MSDADFAVAFKRELTGLLGKKVVPFTGHMRRGRAWLGGVGHPRAVMIHHTAGAATSSTDPKHPGNQKGANDGVIAWCLHRTSDYPWCNLTLDRDGSVYLNSLLSAWHSGLGSFRNTPWARLGIPDNGAHLGTLGVEVVSKGQTKDFTAAQLAGIDAILVAARAAYGYAGFEYRVMNHKDWAPTRKVDTLYPWDLFRDRARTLWKKEHNGA